MAHDSATHMNADTNRVKDVNSPTMQPASMDEFQPYEGPDPCDRFVPLRGLEGGHLMTLYTWARLRNFPRLPPPKARYFDVASDTRVLAHCHWQPHRRRCPTLLALHGLEGSSSAHYMRGLADKAFSLGFNVVLLNQRNCGGTEHLSDGLYHSGMSSDPAAVIEELGELDGLTRIAVVGYSLGGNIALRLAGAHGPSGPAGAITSVCAVSPTMDLRRCVDALEQPSNLLYQLNFVRNLRGRMRRKSRAFPGRFNLNTLSRVRTVRGFDEAFTAPHHGFKDAEDYYFRASSLRIVNKIAIPTLIVSSKDDPFVPSDQFGEPSVVTNPAITTTITDYGGHCGFLSRSSDDFDGYWAEKIAIKFSQRHSPKSAV
jgi:predicted alpha/beta-fold hydrolase